MRFVAVQQHQARERLFLGLVHFLYITCWELNLGLLNGLPMPYPLGHEGSPWSSHGHVCVVYIHYQYDYYIVVIWLIEFACMSRSSVSPLGKEWASPAALWTCSAVGTSQHTDSQESQHAAANLEQAAYLTTDDWWLVVALLYCCIDGLSSRHIVFDARVTSIQQYRWLILYFVKISFCL